MTIDGNTTAFIFPGQGSQAVGMGKLLAAEFAAARETFQEADSILGQDFSALMWDGPDSALNDTLNTQPALFIHSIAALRVLQTLQPGALPFAAAGHSLGQLSALTAAGAISFADGLRLVRKRGELMKKAGEINPGGMAAILGVDIPTLDRVCAEASSGAELVQVANDNCPGQVVISGHKPALERAMAGAKAAGAKRALPLAVSIAAHSPLMDSIQGEWNDAVAAAAFVDAPVRVIGNVSAQPVSAAEALRNEIRAQMQNRVRWTESVQWLAANGVRTYLELGSGAVLGGLVKRIAEGVVALSLGNPADFSSLP